MERGLSRLRCEQTRWLESITGLQRITRAVTSTHVAPRCRLWPAFAVLVLQVSCRETSCVMSRAARQSSRSAAVVRVVQNVLEQQWLPLEAAWERECRRQNFTDSDRSLLRDICSGTMRHLAYYERLIDYVDPRVSRDTSLRLFTVSTLYQAEHMRRSPTLAALCRAAAECCPAPKAGHMIEDVCRRITKASDSERKEMLCPASELSLPSWLYHRLQRQGPLDEYAPLLLQRPDSLNLFVPPEFSSTREYVRQLARAGWDASSSHLAPHGVLVHSRPRDVGSLPGMAVQDGGRRVHVQDAVQQLAASLLSPLAAGDRVLDACAAPGGKTRALLSYQPLASVLALELDARKAAAMAADMAVRNPRVTVRCGNALEPSTWHGRDGSLFAAILLDAPCSATGLLRTLPEVKAHQTEATVRASAAKQLELLRALWPLLAPGGELVYSTCSILSEENEYVLDAFLKATSDARLLPLERPTSPAALRSGSTNAEATRESSRSSRRASHGRLARDGTQLSPPASLVQHRGTGLVFFPSQDHQGGFLAMLRKAKGHGGSARGVGLGGTNRNPKRASPDALKRTETYNP